MASNLSTPDKRMLQLIDALKQKGTIRYKQEFCDALDIFKQTIVNIKSGSQSFTVTQILTACKTYGVSANWVFGLSEEMYLTQGKVRFIRDSDAGNKTGNNAGNVASKKRKQIS